MNDVLSRLKSSSLLQGFSIYFGTSVANRALPFLLLPVLTAYLSPEQYGLMSLFQAIITISGPALNMNMPVNVTRIFYRASQEEVAATVSGILAILSATGALSLLLLSVFTLAGGTIGSLPPLWLLLIPLIITANSINDLGLTILRNQQKALQYGFQEILKTIIELGLTVYLVVALSTGWEGRAIGILAAALALGVISFTQLAQTGFVARAIRVVDIKVILRISLPFIPHGIGMSVIAMSGRLIIEGVDSAAALGIYTAGAQFGMLMSLVITAFNRSWSPWFYKQLAANTAAARLRIVKTTYAYFVIALCMAGVLTAISLWLMPLMTAPGYHSGRSVIAWTTFGFAFQGMYMTVFGYAVHTAKTSRLALITAGVSVITLALNYFLISHNGIVGAAQATFIAYGLMFLSTWVFSIRIYPMPWQIKRSKIS